MSLAGGVGVMLSGLRPARAPEYVVRIASHLLESIALLLCLIGLTVFSMSVAPIVLLTFHRIVEDCVASAARLEVFTIAPVRITLRGTVSESMRYLYSLNESYLVQVST